MSLLKRENQFHLPCKYEVTIKVNVTKNSMIAF